MIPMHLTFVFVVPLTIEAAVTLPCRAAQLQKACTGTKHGLLCKAASLRQGQMQCSLHRSLQIQLCARRRLLCSDKVCLPFCLHSDT